VLEILCKFGMRDREAVRKSCQKRRMITWRKMRRCESGEWDGGVAKCATLSLSKCVLQKKQQLFLLFFFSGCLGFFVKKHKILFGSILLDKVFHTYTSCFVYQRSGYKRRNHFISLAWSKLVEIRHHLSDRLFSGID